MTSRQDVGPGNEGKDTNPDTTEDVEVLLGNPRKALIAMAVPIAIALIVQSLNNMIDAVWVAGLGTAALASVGVVFPFFFIMIGIGNGIGVGASQAIARRIGEGNRAGAGKVAAQAVVMIIIAGVAMTVIFLFLTEPAMRLAGAGEYLEECVAYGFPILISAPIVLFSSLFTALLRAEGAAKRSMNIQIASALINMVLDPIFIYGFGWGLAGAAWATVVAMLVSVIIPLWWYFVRRDTYIGIDLRGFRFDRELDRDILKVGLPASLEMVLMSLTSLVMNLIIFGVDPVNGIAIYSTGWRVLDMLMIPIMAIGFAVVPICAAAYGSKRYDRIRDGYMYGMRYGIVAMVVISVIVAVIAPYIVLLFTYTGSSVTLAPEMTKFVRVGCIFLPFITLGFVSSGLFQSLGMGMKSLIATMVMNLVRIPVCIALATMGSLTMIWFGIAFSEILGSVIIGLWGLAIIRVLMRDGRRMGMQE